jgi:glutamate carboxypeptidase
MIDRTSFARAMRCCLALTVLSGSPAGAALSETERALAASVDAAVPPALDLLRRAVDINSGTMNFAGVEAVGRLFEPRFRELGFETRWVDGAQWSRAGHLLGERAGTGPGPHVLLIGHLDTVFEADGPFQRWEALPDSMARGPGAIDMKGGIVVLLTALGALHEAGLLDALSLSVVLTGDEEKCGEPISLARRDLLAAAERADAAIGFEDGAGDPRTAVIARRGATRWELRTRGRPAHSSQIFREENGAGAIFEAARILDAFHEELAGEEYLTFNPGVILGGSSVDFDPDRTRGQAAGKINVIAESAVVAGDLRALSEEQLQRAKSAMRRIAGESRAQASAEIVFEGLYPPLAPAEGNRRLLALFDESSRDLGFGPVEAVDPSRAGAADISFTAGLVEMALDGIGLMGTGGHTVEETADLRTLPMQAKRVAVLLHRLARRP